MSVFKKSASVELPRLENLLETNTDPNDTAFNLKLWKFNKWLKHESFAIEFLGCGGVSVLIRLINLRHIGIQQKALGAFLNLLCHYSVVANISLKVDKGVFVELVSLTYSRAGQYNTLRINRANSVLHILLDNATNGPKFFHEAVKVTSASRGLQPYSNFVNFLENFQFCQSTLKVLECAMRNSVIYTFTDDMILMLRNCNIVESLECMKRINVVEKDERAVICEFSKLFGDVSEKVAWFNTSAPCYNIESQVNGIMRANSTLNEAVDRNIELLEVDLLHKVKNDIMRRIATQLEEEMPAYEKCLWELETKVEQQHRENLLRCKSVSGFDISEKQRLENISGEYSQVLPCINVISERNAIRKHPVSWCFYQSLQLNLNHIMVALQCIKSGFIDQADTKSKVAHVLEKTIKISGEAVPLPGINAAATIVNSTMKWYRRSKRKKQNAETSTVAINSGAMEKISEACARLITFRYGEQLSMISMDGAKSLGAFAARLILEGLRSGCLQDLDVSDGLGSQTDIVSRLADVVSAGVSGPSKIKQKKISLVDVESEEWDQVSFFTRPGLQVDGSFFDGGNTDSYKYGYRLGSKEEVVKMGLSKSTCRVMSLVQGTSLSYDHESSLSNDYSTDTTSVPSQPTMPSDIVVVKGNVDMHKYIDPFTRSDASTTVTDEAEDRNRNELSELISLMGALQQQKKEQEDEISYLKQQVRDLIVEAKNLIG